MHFVSVSTDFEKKVGRLWDPLLDQYRFCYQQLHVFFSMTPKKSGLEDAEICDPVINSGKNWKFV